MYLYIYMYMMYDNSEFRFKEMLQHWFSSLLADYNITVQKLHVTDPSYNQCNLWSNPFRPLQAVAVVGSGLIWLPSCALSHHWDCRVKWSPIDTLQAILICSNNQLYLTMYFYCKHTCTEVPLKTVVCHGLHTCTCTCTMYVIRDTCSLTMYLQWPLVALCWFCKITWKGQQWLVCIHPHVRTCTCTEGWWRTY